MVLPEVIVVDSQEEMEEIYRQKIKMPTEDIGKFLKDIIQREYPNQVELDMKMSYTAAAIMLAGIKQKGFPIIVKRLNKETSKAEIVNTLQKTINKYLSE